jgi:hypothetical protein
MLEDWTPEEVAQFEYGNERAKQRALKLHEGAIEEADFNHLFNVIARYRCLLAAQYKISRQQEIIIQRHRNTQAILLRRFRRHNKQLDAMRKQVAHIRQLFQEYKDARA